MLCGRYRVTGTLGAGGQGEVLDAVDTWYGETAVAIKRVGPETHLRLTREFSLLRSLRHPALVQAHDLFTSDGKTYLVETRVDGESLAAWARWRTPPEVLAAVAPVAHALAHLHVRGFVHLDASPSNVLVRPGEPTTAMLIDLGLARRIGESGASGTPGFVAPEVLRGEPVGSAADIYTLGSTIAVALGASLDPATSALDISLVTPNDVRDLIASCLQRASASRPSAHELAAQCAKLAGTRLELLERPLRSVPLCGRKQELAQFAKWVAEGSGTFLVTGQDGMGKSSFLESCADKARLQGYTVLAASAREADAAIRLTVQASSLVPNLSSVFPAQGPADAPSAEEVVLALDAVAQQRPLLIVVDDADAATGPLTEAIAIWQRRRFSQGARVVVARAAGAGEATPLGAGNEPDGATAALGPLSQEEVEQLLCLSFGHRRPAFEAEHLLLLCGGSPAALRRALQVARATGKAPRELAIEDVADTQQELSPLQACLALAKGPIPKAALHYIAQALGQQKDVTAALGEGWLAWREVGGEPLYYVPEAHRITRGSSQAKLAKILAEGLETAGWQLQAAPLWAQTGDCDKALARLAEAASAGASVALSAFTGVCEQLGAAALGSALLEQWLAVANRAVDEQGIRTASAALRGLGRPRAGVLELAAAQVQLGQARQALETLGAQDEDTAPASASTEAPEVAAVWARALYFSAQSDAAREMAERHWRKAAGNPRADLLDILGHSAYRAGDTHAAKDALERALDEAQNAGSVQTLCRAQHGLAIIMQQTGEKERALELYRASLQHGEPLPRLVRTLNLATVLQEMGAWAEARAAYQEAHSRAMALATLREQVRAGVNLANLELQLGELASAWRLAQETLQTAATADLRHAAGMAALVMAEAAIERQDLELSSESLEQAQGFLETVEDRVALAELMLLRARHGAAADDATAVRNALDAVDLECGAGHIGRRHAYYKARLGLALSLWPLEELRNHAENAAQLAAQAQDHDLQWQALAVLTRIAGRLGGEDAGKDVSATRQQARRVLDGVTERLPEELRSSYLGPACRRQLIGWIADPAALGMSMSFAAPGSSDFSLLRRLLAINRRLARTPDFGALLELIVDTAIELLGAERGFVILRHAADGERLEIAVARNFERRALEAGPQRISRTIASECLATAEAILTTNALEDARFAHARSVTTLKVRSVICVPLRGAGRDEDPLLGALYLDHRFAERAFTEADVKFCESFADQAAIALSNARMLEQIREHQRALASQNENLEVLNSQLRKEAGEHAAQAEAALRRLREEGPTVGVGKGFERFVGNSDKLRAALHLVERFADTDVPVMVCGESGTGKELVARAIHDRSGRKQDRFVSINCGALPENLIESELFGYVRGAFTGAARDKQGLFAAAEGGTLLLDEVGEMSMSMQVKLLRVLQERTYRPVGATHSVDTNVRVVSACQANLAQMVEQGRFREDLFYRLQVVEIRMPPLRERPEDIPPLVEHFCQRICGRSLEQCFGRDALASLLGHRWPGNVRELENEVQRALALTDGIVAVSDLSPRLQGARPTPPELVGASRGSLKEMLDGFEKEILVATLERAGWNVRQTAKELGLSRAALYTRLGRFGIKRK